MRVRVFFDKASWVDIEEVKAFWFEDDHLWLEKEDGYTLLPKGDYLYFTIFDSGD